jgi:iron complex outermembrane receptor protein
MKPYNSRRLILSAALSVVFTQHGFAQGNAGPIEEIVVTAQKRVESVQDVPISIVAVTGDELARTGQNDFLNLAGRIPTLQYSQAGGESQIYIRGVGSNLLAVGADPSVAIHLDGVYLGRPNMGMNQFLDVERVEVLRGPQGTLYGRNATGGSINIVSRQPTEETEGYLSVGTGSFSRMEATGAVGGPLSDQWQYRVAARLVQDDGYVDDLDARGTNKLDDQDMTAVRGILKFTPSDTFTASLSLDYSDFSNGNTAVRPNDNTGTAAIFGAVPTGSILEQRNDFNTFMDWETGGPTLTLNWDLSDNLELTSITAFKSFEMDFFFNTEGTEINVTRTSEQFDTEQLSQELRLASTGEGPLQWIAGLYYLDEDKKGALGLVREVGVPSLRSFNIFAENDTKAWALFGEISYELSDRLTLTAGLRYSDEEKGDYNELNFVLATPANPASEVIQGLFGNINYAACGALCPFQSRTDSQSWDNTAPKLGLEFQARDNVLLYASYTEGFKSGGYNDYQPTNPVYDQETVKSFEVGAKTDWMDGRMRFNAAAFLYDYEDLQVTTFFQSLTLVSNAATADIFGVDLELITRPSDELEFGASISFLDATYDRFDVPYGVCSPFVINNFNDPGCADVPGTRPVGSPRIVNASGNNLNNAPEFSGNVYGQYDVALGDNGGLRLFAQLSHTDDVYFNAANAVVARQDAITLLDAQIGWTNASGSLELSLFGKNLTDEEYFHNIVQFTSSSLPPPGTADPAPGAVITDPFAVGHSLGYPAPGRTWGLNLRWNF